MPVLPVEDFARTPELYEIRLSPDGGAIAYRSDFSGRSYLCVRELDSQKGRRFRLGEIAAFGTVVRKEAVDFEWINDQRLLVTTAAWDAVLGVAALDRNGSNWVGLTGYERDPLGQFVVAATDVIHKFDDEEGSVLMLDRRKTSGAQTLYPSVITVSTEDGGIIDRHLGATNRTWWRAARAGCAKPGRHGGWQEGRENRSISMCPEDRLAACRSGSVFAF